MSSGGKGGRTPSRRPHEDGGRDRAGEASTVREVTKTAANARQLRGAGCSHLCLGSHPCRHRDKSHACWYKSVCGTESRPRQEANTLTSHNWLSAAHGSDSPQCPRGPGRGCVLGSRPHAGWTEHPGEGRPHSMKRPPAQTLPRPLGKPNSMSDVTLGTTLDSGQTILLLSVFPQERPPVLLPVMVEPCPPRRCGRPRPW